jgi:hypothetical protein
LSKLHGPAWFVDFVTAGVKLLIWAEIRNWQGLSAA